MGWQAVVFWHGGKLGTVCVCASQPTKHVSLPCYNTSLLCTLSCITRTHLTHTQPRPGETRRTDSLATTLQLMQQLLFDVLPAVGGWRPCEVQLLGFSQGGCTALNLARLCSGPMQLGG